MTDQWTNGGGDDVHALSGAYAVDALDPAERERFEAHLRQCGECRDEVDSLREAAALLSTDDVAPPPALRAQVLAAIDTVRPLPPLTQPTIEQPTPQPVDLAGRRGARRRASRLGRLPLLVAASVILLAAVGGLIVRPWISDDSESTDPPRLSVAEQVLADEDAARIAKTFPDGAEATIVLSREVGRAVIITKDMPAAPDGKDYEIWLETPAGSMIAAGLMPDESSTTLLLEGDASEATGVGITVEPDGGSPEPTSAPIAYFAIA